MVKDDKLKTLEDLSYMNDYLDSLVDSEKLRQELIKWIKVIRKGEENLFFAFDRKNPIKKLVSWIKYFGNITEEELQS